MFAGSTYNNSYRIRLLEHISPSKLGNSDYDMSLHPGLDCCASNSQNGHVRKNFCSTNELVETLLFETQDVPYLHLNRHHSCQLGSCAK